MTTDQAPVTRPWLTKILGGIAGIINKRFDEHESRIVALESHSKEFAYKGVWESTVTYKRNNSATHQGSVWIVRAEQTTQRPGDGSDWTLAVKKGRDA